MSDEVEPIYEPPPLSKSTQLLREKYLEAKAAQSDLMDGLAKQLITVELAIPGLYATVLKLTQGNAATLTVDGWFVATFVLWTAALALTLTALIPRQWNVDPTLIKPDPTVKEQALSLEEFFFNSARYKRRLLIGSSLAFWGGILTAVFTLF